MTRLSLDEARSARDLAREALQTRTEQVREDYAARGIVGRAVDTVLAEASATTRQASEIARESKGVIAITAGLIGLWIFRRPLIDQATRLADTIKDKFDD